MKTCCLCGCKEEKTHRYGESNECYTGRPSRVLYACEHCDPTVNVAELRAWIQSRQPNQDTVQA